MKIIELRAENVKRLKAVEITPDGDVQVIGGRNAQGKSSVLDAIWLALGGGKAAKETTVPIRDGEDRASVTLNLGDLIVTRTWTPKGTSLKVSNADGAAYSSPQSMLDGLVGRLSFDPLAFTRLSAREQREALMDLVDLGVDVDAMDVERARLFDERTRVGRDGKAIGDVTVDESLPEVEESAQDIIRDIRDVEAHNRAVHLQSESLRRCREDAVELAGQIEAAEHRLAELRAAADANHDEMARVSAEAATLGDVLPTDELEARLARVEDTNARIRANNAARQRAQERDALRARYQALSDQIAALDADKQAALASARFPVDGLGFSSDGVTLGGVPFAQASSAEQIRVSLAMGMALNPKLRVLMIKDGSLLDADSMREIREQVRNGDYQLFIERVGNADEGAVIIEDGEVA